MAIFILFAALILLVLLISYYTYRIAFYSPKDKHATADDPMKG